MFNDVLKEIEDGKTALLRKTRSIEFENSVNLKEKNQRNQSKIPDKRKRLKSRERTWKTKKRKRP